MNEPTAYAAKFSISMTEIPKKAPSPLVVKAVAAFGITIALVPLLGLAWFAFVIWSDFQDKTIVQTTSPNGKRTAVLFARDGGATEWFHRFVVLCDGSKGCTADGKNNITEERSTGISTVRWSGNDKLHIYYSPSQTDFDYKRATKNGVKIEYAPTGK